MKKSIPFFFLISFFFNNSLAQNTDDLNRFILNSQFQKAITEANKLLEKYPDNPDILHNAGLAYQMLNNNNKAEKCLKKAYANDSLNIIYINAYANILNNNGNYKKALILYEQALKIDSLNFYSLNNISKILLKQKKYKAALNILIKLSKQDSLNTYYDKKIGFCHIKTDDFNSGIKYYKKAYFKDSTDKNNIKSLAVAYLGGKKIDSAIAVCKKGILQDSLFPDFHKIKADAHFIKNHYYRAAPEYKKVLQLGDTSYNVLKRLGMSLCEIKRYNEALPYNLAVYEQDKSSYSNTVYLYRNYLGLKDYESCLKYAEETLKLLHFAERISYDVYDNMALAYSGKGRYTNALEMYLMKETVYKSDPHYFNLNNIYQIALTYDKLKNKKNALKYYQKILHYYDNKQIKDYDTPIYKYAKQRERQIKEDLFFEVDQLI